MPLHTRRELSASTANTSNAGIDPFSGDPAEIVVQIDAAEPLHSEWPAHPIRLRANETPRT